MFGDMSSASGLGLAPIDLANEKHYSIIEAALRLYVEGDINR